MDNSHHIENNGEDEKNQSAKDPAHPAHALPAEPILYDASGAVVKHPEEEARIKAEKAAEEIKSGQTEILGKIKTSERLMIFFTAIVALTTLAQFMQSCSNNESTAKQVDRMIDAAKTQASAAQKIADASKRNADSAAQAADAADDSATAAASFSKSAEGINKRMQLAVTELKGMVEAANTANENTRNASRPLVKLRSENMPKTPDLHNLNGGTQVSFDIDLQNVGSSPAIAAKNPSFRVGRWPKKEIRYILAAMGNGITTEVSINNTVRDICKVEAMPSPVPGQRFARFTVPIYQNSDATVTAYATEDRSRPPLKNALYDDFIGCIVYSGLEEKRFYRLLVLYSSHPSEPEMRLEQILFADDLK